MYCAEGGNDYEFFRQLISRAFKRLAEASEKLFKALNDGQKALLEEYRAAFDDCVDAVHVEAFRQGFMLGTEFIKETKNDSRPPVSE